MRHPGLLRFAEEMGTTGDPVAAIRQRSRAVVVAAAEQGWSGPPWDVEVLASLCDIRVEETDLLAHGQDALWTSGRVIVSRHAPRTRRRYSIAHEIVHSFLAMHDEGVNLSAMGAAEQERAEGELEYLCQVGAAELLMPHDSFGPRMGGGMPNVISILHLSREFEVSPEAAARRSVDLAEVRCAVLCAQPWGGEPVQPRQGRRRGPSPRVSPKPDDLVVTAYHPSRDFAVVRVALGEPVPRDFHAHRAFRMAESRPAKDHRRRNVAPWPAYPELGEVDMEAVPLPLRKRPIEILAVLRRAVDS